MGHDSVEAAMIYQYATAEADRAVADKLDDRLMRECGTEDDGPDDGAAGVLGGPVP